MEALLDEAQRTYPDQPAGPDDRWWLPVHLGGTAPTPEEAAVQDSLRAAGKATKAPKRVPGGPAEGTRHPPALTRPARHSTTTGAMSRNASSSTSYQRRSRPSGAMPSRRQTAMEASFPGRTTA